MRAMRWLLVAASLGLAAVATSGCDASAPPEQPAPAPLFASDEEAFAAAEATYRAYTSALNRVDLSDPATFQAVYDLTVGDLNAVERKGFSELHAAGVTKFGHETNTLIARTVVDPFVGKAELAVCNDISDVRLVEADGTIRARAVGADVLALTVMLEPSKMSDTGMAIVRIFSRMGEPVCEG